MRYVLLLVFWGCGADINVKTDPIKVEHQITLPNIKDMCIEQNTGGTQQEIDNCVNLWAKILKLQNTQQGSL